MVMKQLHSTNISEKEKNYQINQINCMNEIQSDRLVSMIDAFKTKENTFIIMEYCEGGNLREYLI